MEFYRMAAGDYRPLPELPNRTSPSRGPRGLKKYCEHSVEQAIYRFFASDHEVPDELALDPLSVKITFATLSVLHGVVKHAIFAGVYR